MSSLAQSIEVNWWKQTPSWLGAFVWFFISSVFVGWLKVPYFIIVCSHRSATTTKIIRNLLIIMCFFFRFFRTISDVAFFCFGSIKSNVRSTFDWSAWAQRACIFELFQHFTKFGVFPLWKFFYRISLKETPAKFDKCHEIFWRVIEKYSLQGSNFYANFRPSSMRVHFCEFPSNKFPLYTAAIHWYQSEIKRFNQSLTYLWWIRLNWLKWIRTIVAYNCIMCVCE